MFTFIYSGKLAENAKPNRVKTNLARAFGVEEAELDGLFSGEQEFVREGLDETTAQSYQSLFKRAGAISKIIKVQEQAAETPELSESSESTATVPRPTDVPFANNTESGSAHSFTPQQSLASRDRQLNSQAAVSINKRDSSEPWLRYGGLAVVGMLIADAQLQDALIIDRYGLDLGYLPLFLAHIPLFIGCYLLAKEKQLAPVFRFFGLFSFAGLSILLLMPDKRISDFKVSLNAMLVTVLSCGVFIYWFGESLKNSVSIDTHMAKLAELSVGREEFPSDSTQSGEQLYLEEREELRLAMQEVIDLANSGDLRPNQATQLADEMMNSLADYSAWRQYQTYLHRKNAEELPVGLSEEFQEQDDRVFSSLLSSVNNESNPRLYESITTWLVAPMNDSERAKTSTMRSQMNTIFDSVRDAIITQLAPPRGRSENWVRPERIDLDIVNFPQIDGASLTRFRDHIEYRFHTPPLADRTLAIGFYMVPGKKTWSQKDPLPRLVYATLNNDVPAKYTSNLISVLQRYQ